MLAWKRRLDALLAGLLVALMAAMVLAVLWQVTTRYVLGSPSSWTEELARYLMIWIGLLGGAYAVGQHIHLAMDLIKIPGRAQDRLVQVVIAAFAFFALVIGGIFLVKLSFDLGQTSPALSSALGVGVPVGLVYVAIPLSGLLTIFYALCELVHPRSTDGRDAG